ncbi:flagellar motor protein MotS [Piscibacillus salipiscarius]|uniref:flagellar motor protein MotS n=1 Tax=Piscibacillus salipiscarius TaxID=299480 RepID=UPI000B01F80C
MNLNRKRKKKQGKQAPLWMVTYSDMVTLILVFFILLFSMSQIDAEKLKTVTESYQQRVIFDYYPSPVELERSSDVKEDEKESENITELQQPEPIASDDFEKQIDELEKLLQQIEEYIRNEGLSDVISATRTDEGVVLVLQENVLFESGEAQLIGDALPLLNKVATLLENIPNLVKVEGHTDPRPIKTSRFPSNWELSGARASSVVRYFVEEQELGKSRFQIAGYADTKPIVSNDSNKI